MKKILVFLLAITMAFAFAACIGDTEPVDDANNNEQQEQNTQAPDADESEETAGEDDEQANAATFEWPTADYILSYMKWTGAGKIVNVTEKTYQDENTGADFPVTKIYFDVATFEEVEAYINELKNNGFSYLPFFPGEMAEDEPTAVENGTYNWVGTIPNECYISVSFAESPRKDMTWLGSDIYEFDYTLVIAVTPKTLESGRIAVA